MNQIKKLLQEINMENEKLMAQKYVLRSIKMEIINRLSLLLEEIHKIFIEMQKYDNEKEATIYFTLLEEIQGKIALLISEDNIKVPDPFWKLYKDFDHLDLVEERERLFNAIKSGHYTLESKTSRQ